MLNAILIVPRFVFMLFAAVFKSIFGVSIKEATADMLIVTLIGLGLVFYVGFGNIMLLIFTAMVLAFIYEQLFG